MRPLKDLKKAVYYAMDNNVKRKSRNGRTFYSDYHKPGMDLNMAYRRKKKRALLAMTILGDQRPYTIAVLYKIEKLKGGEYSSSGYDKQLAAKYLERVKEYLAGRPEERDIIDDFRPY